MSGLLSTGFEIKRLQEILEELQANVHAEFGAEAVTHAESGFGRLCGILAEPLAELWELAQAVHSSQYPTTAAGVSLDNVLAINNLTRLDEEESTAWQLLVGDPGTVISSGSQVEHESTGARFETQSEETLDADQVLGAVIEVSGAANGLDFTITIDGHAYLVTAGPGDVDADVATDLVAAIDPELAITAVSEEDKTFTVAGDQRTFFAIGKRCRVTGGSDHNDEYTVADLEYAGGNTTVTVSQKIGAIGSPPDPGNLRGYVVATADGAEITLAAYPLPDVANDADDYAFAYTVDAESPGDLTETEISVPHLVKATETGVIGADLGTLTTIATPVSGWTSTTNVIEADVGRVEESDVDARQRRCKSLLVNRLTTRLLAVDGVDGVKVYENDTGETDDDGRPGHSVECVVTGGTDTDVAETIYQVKAAGIQTYGNNVQYITDDNDKLHAIYFSRVVEVPIYVAVTVNSLYDEEDLPTSAADAIKQAVVDYGDTYVGGMDVINQRISGAIMTAVAGLESLTVNIGTSYPAVATTTISIDSDEIATFAIVRITVTGV
ncbi:MAG: hypothetical protein V2A73_16095 [Pseudomonadota bacterium]